MHDGEAEVGNHDHHAVQNHERDLVVGQMSPKAFAQFDRPENGPDEDTDRREPKS